MPLRVLYQPLKKRLRVKSLFCFARVGWAEAPNISHYRTTTPKC